jgi:amino acid transporter
MNRSVTTMTLLLTSVSAILGSGWLFTAFYASQHAGPASLLGWLLAGIAMIFVAFVFAELNAMLPVMGSSTRIPQMTHGTLTGFMYSWIIWLCYASIGPTEVQAILQYLSFYFPALTFQSGGLTHIGYSTAVVMMLFMSALNAYSIRWVLKFNNALTIIKILIPFIIVAFICYYYFDVQRIIHTNQSTFFPLGIKGMLSAISTGGMVYAFNGFRQACELGGAAKNPGKSLPIAIIGSIFLTMLIYIGLQTAFLTSLTPHNLRFGWQNLDLSHAISPLAAIMSQGGFNWLLPLLYVGAIVGPFAAGLIYVNGAAQSLRSKSINGYLPAIFQKLSPQHTPVFSIFINFIFGIFLFAPLPGWDKMMGFLTSLMAFTYTIGPVCMVCLRDQAPNQHRPFRLPFGKAWGFLAFYLCTIFSYFNGWDIISKLSVGFIAGFIVLVVYRYTSKNAQKPELNWRASMWMWPYIAGLTLFSYLGTFGHGIGVIPFGWDLILLFLFSCFIMYLAQRFKLPADTTQEYIETLGIKEAE